MRRTFNNLARLAAGEIVARAMTGHATSAMTERYSYVSLDEKHKALDAAPSARALLGFGVGVEPISAETPTRIAGDEKRNPRRIEGFALELPPRIELGTSSLPRTRSTI